MDSNLLRRALYKALDEHRLPDGTVIYQHSGSLRARSANAFCCLGVACEVFRQLTHEGEWDNYQAFNHEKHRERNFLPESVAKAYGFASIHPVKAAEFNDVGMPFPEIRAKLEKKYPIDI